VSLHKIPNIGLGKVRRRHITRIFFPMMYQEGASAAISQQTLGVIYNQCVRPAVLRTNPVDQSHWPINYAAAAILNRDRHGRLHFPSVDISANFLNDFAVHLLDLFDQHNDLRNAFFVHELRGTKGESQHDPQYRWECRDALDDIMEFVDLGRLDHTEWIIDVAFEIRHAGHVVQWLTTAHRGLLKYALPSANDAQISAVLKSAKQFRLDRSAQLEDLAGCRVTPGIRGRPDGVVYVNIYTTDKSATYQLHHGVFSHHQAWELFPAAIAKLMKEVERIGDVFLACGGDEDGENGLEGCARFELRVPLQKANDVLTDISDELVQDSVVSYTSQLWW
jgi:hypothetical protein